jgi:hypothetical protein
MGFLCNRYASVRVIITHTISMASKNNPLYLWIAASKRPPSTISYFYYCHKLNALHVGVPWLAPVGCDSQALTAILELYNSHASLKLARRLQ